MAVSPSTIVAEVDSGSTFTISATADGAAVNSGITARLRRESGALLADASCATATTDTTSLVCTTGANSPSAHDKVLVVEISVNDGADYMSNFATISVVEKAQVLMLRSFHLFAGGGNRIDAIMLKTQVSAAVSCVFTTTYKAGSYPSQSSDSDYLASTRQYSNSTSVMAFMSRNDTMSCISPVLPPGGSLPSASCRTASDLPCGGECGVS